MTMILTLFQSRKLYLEQFDASYWSVGIRKKIENVLFIYVMSYDNKRFKHEILDFEFGFKSLIIKENERRIEKQIFFVDS